MLLRLVSMVALCPLASCGPDHDPSRHRDLILVTIDTLRADHLGVYGYSLDTSPSIDALAQSSIVFESASSTCPATAPSIASILTGHHRATHGVVRNGAILLEDVDTLAELLKEQDYETVGIISNPVLIEGDTGFGQGFDRFFMPEAMPRRAAARFNGASILPEVENIFDKRDKSRRLFLWIHYMDPHGAYAPPEEADVFTPEQLRWDIDRELPLSKTNYGFDIIPRYQRIQYEKSVITGQPAEYRARYDGEIRYVDSLVGELIESLAERGVLDQSLFVLTADHGESLGEHTLFFQHGWFNYENCLAVPLILRAPQLYPQPKRIPATVSLLDLTPTLLELLGVGVPSSIEGESLVPVLEGNEGDRHAFAQSYGGNRLSSVRFGKNKYIFTPAPPPEGEDRRFHDSWKEHWPLESRQELYDLDDDPGELRDLSEDHEETRQKLHGLLVEWLSDQTGRAEERPRKFRKTLGLDQALESLGYLK